MRTSSNSAPAPGKQHRGFSLLELLLTLVVIGLIVSLAGVTVNSGRRPYQIDAQAKHFADVAQYALDEAQLSGTDMGMLLELRQDGEHTIYSYQWLQRAGDVWRVAPFDEDAYGRRDLPVDVEVFLEMEEETSELEEEDDRGTLPPAPQVVFYASGETTPGIMTWVDDSTGDVLWELEWDLLGRFDLRRRGLVNEEDDE